ncbi:glycosyltransferase family 2 protein [Haloechinothrix sp. YIM 98757]|uniref:Glycosyltransferase family 2 protein n=1 Tax=Haloechinothrix aidingensis TaxID=2752311 RepID=A0A838A8U4_9PSEU|nr:glycosyltransferase family 2 protein [Haloechinothrix aidingensis]MBA0125237.1 glycosyltransferase family 2 protein [Haloechinothrix aidingensis]
MNAISCIVLTQNKRPDNLRRGVESLLQQQGVTTDIIVVGNGVTPEGLDENIRVMTLPENVGIPGGRNAGISKGAGDLVFFLDDDAFLDGKEFLERAAAMFKDDPSLGLVQPRVRDPDGMPTPRRFVPRLLIGDPDRGGDVVNVWEGACVARRDALESAGAWPEEFFYMHEGIDLSWRVMDAGYAVRYCTEICAYHSAVPPERHPQGRYMSARNRVWLAKRNLPAVLGAIYILAWFLIDTTRLRNLTIFRQHLRGYYDGLRLPCAKRSPISWNTILRMARLGRPPII